MSTAIADRLTEIADIPLAEGNHETMHLCACGCGHEAPIASRTSAKSGTVRGDRLKFLSGHNKRVAPDLGRFEIVDAGYVTHCWEWRGAKDRKGYGRIQVRRVHRPAHAVSYEATYAPITRGLVLDHLCRNRLCIRPDHLEQVTPAINTRRGSLARLTDVQVLAIRNDARSASIIARETGMSRQAISDIKNGRRWKSLQKSALQLVERMISAGME